MTSTLKVNGLTYRTIERDVERIFDKYGKINEVFIPKDKYSGKSKGFAFVRFYTRDEARDAFDDQDGRMHDGRRITIEWSRKDDGNERRAANKYRRSRSRSPPVRRRRSRTRSRSRSVPSHRDRDRDVYRERRQSRSRSRSRERRASESSPGRPERRRSGERRPRSRSGDRRRY